MTARQVVILLSAALLLIGGCAGKSKQNGFDDVRAIVANRNAAGSSLRVEWSTDSASDAQAEKALRDLLSRSELSADDAVQIALLNNRRLQATFEDLGVAQADLVQAGLLRNPVFDAAFKFDTGGGGTNVEMTVAQDFLDIFQLPLRKRIAGFALAESKWRVASSVLSFAGEVKQAFYEHQAANQMLEMRRSVATATATSFDFARRLRAAGNITQLQLAREQALDEEAKVELSSAEADLLATRERLNAFMGVWGADTQWKAAARLPELPKAEIDVAHVESRAIEKSVDVAIARSRLDAAADGLGIKRSTAIFGGGDVQLGAAAERETEGGWGVGPSVSVPVPLFDTGSASVSRAQAELRQARQNYTASAVEVRSAARAARDKLLAARTRAETFRDVILPLRHSIVEQTQAENNAMLVGTFDVLRAKQDEIEAGGQYVQALRDYWLARAEFERISTGGPIDSRSSHAAQ